jgi:hypothetical protein
LVECPRLGRPMKREIADLTSAIGMAAAGDSCRCWRVLLMS